MPSPNNNRELSTSVSSSTSFPIQQEEAEEGACLMSFTNKPQSARPLEQADDDRHYRLFASPCPPLLLVSIDGAKGSATVDVDVDENGDSLSITSSSSRSSSIRSSAQPLSATAATATTTISRPRSRSIFKHYWAKRDKEDEGEVVACRPLSSSSVSILALDDRQDGSSSSSCGEAPSRSSSSSSAVRFSPKVDVRVFDYPLEGNEEWTHYFH